MGNIFLIAVLFGVVLFGSLSVVVRYQTRHDKSWKQENVKRLHLILLFMFISYIIGASILMCLQALANSLQQSIG